jgi:DNA (cytosine-5)-methyltransferase 1
VKKIKRPPVLRTWLDDAIIADSFAGGGGASSGIELALGRSPDVAINHDPEAIAMHAANHPSTRHFIENVWSVDPRVACAGKRVGLMWMSPTCTHFSKAKGTALCADSVKIRALCWIAIRWAAAVKPRVIFCENVEEFEKYGPLHRHHTDGCHGHACTKDCTFGRGKSKQSKRHITSCPGRACIAGCLIHKPIKSRIGETFRAFVSKLRRYYKNVEWRQLRACDFGAPTTRKRLFLIASDEPIRWPVPTHGPKTARPYRTAAECIDWSIPCPSIFDRDKPLADKTLARIARGIQKFVLENPRPFIVPSPTAPQSGSQRPENVEAPLPTICAGSADYAIAAPLLLKAKTYGGGGNDARSVDQPLNTITASKRGEHAVAEVKLVPTGAFVMPNNTNNVPKSVGEPVPTITTGNRNFLAVPYLIHRSNGERTKGRWSDDGAPQAPRVYDANKPLGTIVAQGQKHAACVALLIKHQGGHNDEHGSSGQYIDKPMDTLATHNTKALTVAHLVRYNSENSAGSARGQEVEAPMSTVDTANRIGVVASHLVKLRGTSDAHVDSSASSMEEPIPTISASGTHVAQVSAFLVRYNGQSVGQEADEPIGTLDTTDRYGLITVTIEGEEYVLADIGMRMLSPRELYRAQGFSDEYQIAPTWNGKPLSKTAQIRCVGNSVCPPLAAAIVRAQLGLDEAEREAEAA